MCEHMCVCVCVGEYTCVSECVHVPENVCEYSCV